MKNNTFEYTRIKNKMMIDLYDEVDIFRMEDGDIKILKYIKQIIRKIHYCYVHYDDKMYFEPLRLNQIMYDKLLMIENDDENAYEEMDVNIQFKEEIRTFHDNFINQDIVYGLDLWILYDQVPDKLNFRVCKTVYGVKYYLDTVVKHGYFQGYGPHRPEYFGKWLYSHLIDWYLRSVEKFQFYNVVKMHNQKIDQYQMILRSCQELRQDIHTFEVEEYLQMETTHISLVEVYPGYFYYRFFLQMNNIYMLCSKELRSHEIELIFFQKKNVEDEMDIFEEFHETSEHFSILHKKSYSFPKIEDFIPIIFEEFGNCLRM